MPHPALMNQDVLFEVFRYLGRERWDERRRAIQRHHSDEDTLVLASCARVCQAFREPSLRVLWGYLPSIVPLLQLFGSHFRLEHRREVHRGWYAENHCDTYVLSHPPDEYQWSRFREYATYVRVLHETYSPGVVRDCDRDEDEVEEWPAGRIFSSSVWFHLAHSTRGGPLLPALRELDWFMLRADQTMLLHVLAGPRLQKLSAHFFPLFGEKTSTEEHNLAFPLFLRNAASLSPWLQELDISSCDSLSDVSRMLKLRTLTITGTTSVDALWDAKLDALEELESLTIALAPHQEAARRPSLVRLLPLRTLDLSYPCIPNTQLVPIIPLFAPNLRVLHIRLGTYSTTTWSRDLCVELIPRFPAVHSISMDLYRHPAPTAWTSLQTRLEVLLALEPLFGIPSVRDFSLRCGGAPMAFTAAEMRTIAEAWPHLSTMSVDLSRRSIWGKQGLTLTVSALVDMARSGCGLRVLHIDHLCIDMFSFNAFTERRARTNPLPQSSSIEVLKVDYAETDGSASEERLLSRCAMLVARLFPNIDTKRSRTEHDPLLAEPTWNKVLERVDLVRPETKNVSRT